MATETEVANRALISLGGGIISDLDERLEPARLCKATLPSVLRQVLRDHPWNFAERRAVLARLAEAPIFGFSYAYQLPADFVRVNDFNRDGASLTDRYRLAGQQILTDATEARLTYGAVVDVAYFDPLAEEAAAMLLAARIGFSITGQNRAATADALAAYEQVMRQAKARDGQEGSPVVIDSSSWRDAQCYGVPIYGDATYREW